MAVAVVGCAADRHRCAGGDGGEQQGGDKGDECPTHGIPFAESRMMPTMVKAFVLAGRDVRRLGLHALRVLGLQDPWTEGRRWMSGGARGLVDRGGRRHLSAADWP